MEMSTFKMVSLNHIIEKAKQEQISNEYRVSEEQVSNGYRVSEKLGKVLQSFSFVTIIQALTTILSVPHGYSDSTSRRFFPPAASFSTTPDSTHGNVEIPSRSPEHSQQ